MRAAAPRAFSAPDLAELRAQVGARSGLPVDDREATAHDGVWAVGDDSLLFAALVAGERPGEQLARGVLLDKWGAAARAGREDLVPQVEPYQDHDGLLYRTALAYHLDIPVAFHGHTGVGKTELVRYLACLLQAPLYRLNLHGLSTTDDIIGKLLPAGAGEVRFQDGLVTTAVRHGGVLLLEELNATGQEVWFSLHGLLDQSRALVLVEKDNEVVRQHPNCRIFSTFNPPEFLTLYPGTKELSTAYLRRWASIRIGFLEREAERALLLRRFPELAAEECRADVEAMLEVAALSQVMLEQSASSFPFVFATGVLHAWARLVPYLGPLPAARMTFYDVLDERLKAVFREQVFAYSTPWDLSALG